LHPASERRHHLFSRTACGLGRGGGERREGGPQGPCWRRYHHYGMSRRTIAAPLTALARAVPVPGKRKKRKEGGGQKGEVCRTRAAFCPSRSGIPSDLPYSRLTPSGRRSADAALKGRGGGDRIAQVTNATRGTNPSVILKCGPFEEGEEGESKEAPANLL